MKTTEEFVIKKKEEEAKIKQRQNQCFICNAIIDGDQKKNRIIKLKLIFV